MPIPASNLALSPTAMEVDAKPSVCPKCSGHGQRCQHVSLSQTQNNGDTADCPMEDVSSDSRTEHTRWRHPMLTYRKDDEPWVDISDRRLPTSRIGALYAGSKFTGVQKCNPKSYEVAVDILHVDLNESVLSGYLNIKGLTSELPELTGNGAMIEVSHRRHISKVKSLVRNTRSSHENGKLSITMTWITGRFPSFKPYINTFNQDDFVYDPINSDYIYMRWKEYFLVPDHHVHTIDGASYAGFYYICYQRSTNEIAGFYYYKNNIEW
ncbi:hypothetical protein EC973_001839 [Apophysomyces ossiformis]|uniref:Vacuolar import and degradation protein n=1 Tax=Apophysomyces ossiformis TaxID=679940 RepID=A0A8H7ERK5_9FUNG|nr:hypothetical protein EC973_001839 [Apophysomyces ossiformis]